MSSGATTQRRGFLGRMAAAAVAASAPWSRTAEAQQDGPDEWLKAQTGAHRCLFDFPQHRAGVPLVHIFNYLATYKAAYGESAPNVSAVGTFYGVGPDSSIPLAFNDKIWSDYELGEYMSLADSQTGRPAKRNLFHRPQQGDPILALPGIPMFIDAGIESLQKMGTTFLLCSNALQGWSLMLAHQGKGKAEEIGANLQANLLPGVVAVPAMVIAIEKAQGAGISYNRQ